VGTVIVVDHLYGAIVVSEWLHPIVRSPEVQRLKYIRLINVLSPSCPALSDARRFVHTLGVLSLASRLEKEIVHRWSRGEARAFLVAALLHVIGTPPFGHLFEYQLAATENWNHEEQVAAIIRGTYRPEKRYHQIYY
jgi:HD superfamily phosphohydrolase